MSEWFGWFHGCGFVGAEGALVWIFSVYTAACASSLAGIPV
jgi:hypothetical protein